MKKRNYELLKQQLELINEIEGIYAPAQARGEKPEIDGKTYEEAVLDQAGFLIISLEEVLKDEEDHLVDQQPHQTITGCARKENPFFLA